MSLKVAFQMEPMDEVNPDESATLSIMLAAFKRGYEVYQYEPSNLTMSKKGVFASAQMVELDMNREPFYSLSIPQLVDLASVDVVHMRQDPPFNIEYITATFILEEIKHKTLVINDPVSVRNAPEKLLPFAIRQFMPETIITGDFGAAQSFLEAQKEIIIKPLYLFGGHDVHHITQESKNFVELFNNLVEKHQSPIVLQDFIHEVRDGDKRVVLIDGEVKGVFLRIPKEGSVIANYGHGSKIEKTQLNARDREICQALRPVLQERGFMICAIDIIGDYLTEVNVTSPGGFKMLEDLYDENISDYLWDVIEKKLSG